MRQRIDYINFSRREFGYKVIDVKSLLKKLPVLLEDRDKNVRDEAKTLAVELFKWIGPVLKTHLSSLKPVQVMIFKNFFLIIAEFDEIFVFIGSFKNWKQNSKK